MALLIRSSRVLQRVSALNSAASYASHAPVKEVSPIGNREVVGYGGNGTQSYIDTFDFPMPAVRFKAPTPDIQVKFTFSIKFCS